VPGLIEGAHANVGLGHEFLRHIERCKIIVLLLDMAGTDGRKPWDDYKQLLAELELYDPALVKKPRSVVANKMDEPAAETYLKQFKQKVKKTPVLPIAAAFDEGIDKFKTLIREAVEKTSLNMAGLTGRSARGGVETLRRPRRPAKRWGEGIPRQFQRVSFCDARFRLDFAWRGHRDVPTFTRFPKNASRCRRA
jgi:GTPase involved in cell partitioning and DNA repair